MSGPEVKMQDNAEPQLPAGDPARLGLHLLDAIGEAVMATDLDGHILYWNAAAQELMGWTAAEALGRPATEVTTVEAIRAQTETLRETLVAGNAWSGEFEIRRRDGSTFPGLVRISPLRDDEGNIEGLIAVTVDISDRKRKEQQLALQYQITRILSDSDSITSTREPILRSICEALDWDVGGWWRLEGGELVCSQFWSRPELSFPNFAEATTDRKLPLGVGFPGRVFAEGEPAWVEDLGLAPKFPRAPAAEQDGLRSAFGFPIRAGDNIMGVIEFFSRERRPREEDLLPVMATIGGQIGHFMETSRAEEALLESEERYRRLVELSPEPIAVHQEGRWVYLNAAASSLFGAKSDDELLGRPVLDFVHEDYKPLVRERIRQVLEEGRTAELIEEKFLRLDGDVVDVEVVATGTTFRGLPAYQLMVRDVTERKRAEAARREAEEKYRGIFENAVFGVFQTTPEGRFVSANQELARMFGYDSPDELISGVTDIGTEIHADAARRAEFARLLEEEGYVSGFEAKARRRDGSTIDISLSGRAAKDARGRVVAFEGIVEDVTERKQAEEQLKEQKRVLETIEQVGASLASELDLQKTGQAVTDAATELTGARVGAFFYRHQEEDGEEYFTPYAISGGNEEAFEALAYPGNAECFAATFEGLGIVRSDDVLADQGSRESPYFGLPQLDPPLRSYLAVPVVSQSGAVAGGLVFGHVRPRAFGERHEALAVGIARWAGIAVDNARLYSEAQVIQEQLRQANEAKDEFLGLVSHELRTPITTIYGGARLLQSRGSKLDQERKEEILSDIEQESDRLYRLVEDLLALARLELGASVGLRPVLVQRVLEKILASFSRRRPSRQIETDVEALPPVQADATYIEQILRNLIINSDKYSAPEEPIVITGEVADDEVVVRVLDRGPGLSAGEVQRIFERFYRAEKTARQAGGLGIGLTVCKRLAEAQGGRIWAEPRPGGGLVMSFTVPIAGAEFADS